MSPTGSPARQGFGNPGFAWVLLALVALTAIRIAGLYFSTVDLYFDEAQYWAWSRELAFGYFSKPPLLAWIIAASSLVCGSGEACFRAVSPIFYLATSLVIYAIADALYGRTVATWSALVCALATGVAFSSRIISTDVPLLLFWAVALLAYVKLLPAPDWRWAGALGVALGLGLLAKYAMVYFALCAICAAVVDREARTLLTRPQTWVALLIAAAMLSPNIYWNLANGLVTFKHTGGNITGDLMRFQPKDMLDFAAAQFAVAGPVVFATFLILLVRMFSGRIERPDRLMLAFAIPVLGLITALSAFRPANANWAAPSILSMIIVAVAWWVRNGQRHALRATITIGLLAQALLLVGDAYAYRISIPVMGRNIDVYRRTLGWREFGRHAAELARANHAPTVVAEGRGEVAELIYDLRDEPVRTLSWPESEIPEHQFDLTRALDNSAAEPVLFVSTCPVVSRTPALLRRRPAVGANRYPHWTDHQPPVSCLQARGAPPADWTARTLRRNAGAVAQRLRRLSINCTAAAKASSAFMSVVSRRCASTACTSGAAVRERSRSSRRRMSARTSPSSALSPRPCSSSARRRARTSGAAVTKIFTSAFGQITVPMSRPSSTAPGGVAANSCWKLNSAARTSGMAETTDAASPTA